MSFNIKGNPAQIAWSTFGGLDTEIAPPDQPEGLSPDCQDVAWVPGSIFTRPGATKMLPTAALGVGNSCNYNKTFVQPSLKPLNLYLSGTGSFQSQDPSVFGVPLPIFQTVPGAYASSVTAFGREYITVHDGQNALDIPRQYDPTLVGNNSWRRITQDGPATTITATDAANTTVTIASGNPDGIIPVGVLGGAPISSAINVAQVVTITTTVAHGFNVGDIVVVYGVTPSQYNGTFTIATVPTSTTFTYNVNATFAAGSSFGTAAPVKVTVNTTTPHGLFAGDTFTITGDSNNSYNNSQTASIGLLSGGLCTFFPYSHSNGGAFNYTNANLPGNSGTYSLTNNQGITFNPSNSTDNSFYLSGVPAGTAQTNSILSGGTMNVYGINASGAWNGQNNSISAQCVENWCMAVTFNLSIPSSGTWFFRIIHDDGIVWAMGGGVTLTTGTLLDGFNHTATAKLGLSFATGSVNPVAGTNQSTDTGHVNYYNESFTVSVPAAGIYPVEIDYVNWEHAQMLVMQYSTDGVTWKTIQPGVPAFNTPPFWTVNTITTATQFTFNSVLALSLGEGGTLTVGGLSAPGTHQLCCSFQTDTGFVTKPSPISTWVSAGNKRVTVASLPIGPPNVVARIVHFTGALGGNFFYIPTAAFDPTTGATVATSTVVPDNTSTTATFDFSDNTLFTGIGIDITGNNLFNQVTLGPSAGVFAYSNRLIVWGDTNNIKNLLNTGFEGGGQAGSAAPAGWDSSQNVGGVLASVGDFYLGWQITGNGLSGNRGQLQQGAFNDSFHIPILTPNTQYTFKLWAQASTFGLSGNLICDLFSPSGGTLATATIPVSSISVTSGTFVSAVFGNVTPATIPADTLIRVYAQNLPSATSITLDEMMVVFTLNPIILGQARVSYAINPEAFDGVTGLYAIEYPEQLMQLKIIRDNLYTLSTGHLVRTTDNGVGEPTTWTNYTVSDISGGMSLRCFDVAEGWGMFAAESGLYAFSGAHPEKVSQEIQTLWDAIDPNLRKHVWVTNDPVTRRVYVGVPLTAYSPTGATFAPASCNKLLVLDYRNLNTAEAVQGQGPVRLGFSGKLIATDFSRKWTVWNLPMNHGAIMSQSGDNEPQIVFAGGNGAGLTGGFGNSYLLTQNKGFDDDYGTIGISNGEGFVRPDGTFRPNAAYYVTYFVPSHEQEQAFGTGSARKLYVYLDAYVSGLGYLYVVPLLDRLGKGTTRPPKSRLMSQAPGFDLEWPLNVQANRVALLIYAKSTVT